MLQALEDEVAEEQAETHSAVETAHKTEASPKLLLLVNKVTAPLMVSTTAVEVHDAEAVEGEEVAAVVAEAEVAGEVLEAMGAAETRRFNSKPNQTIIF